MQVFSKMIKRSKRSSQSGGTEFTQSAVPDLFAATVWLFNDFLTEHEIGPFCA